MFSTAGYNHKGSSSFPRREEHTQAYNFWEHLIIQLLWTNGWLILLFSTQKMSYPSRKWGCGVSPRFNLVFVMGVNQEKLEAGGARDYQHQWWKASPQTFQLEKFIGGSCFLNCIYCLEVMIQNCCIWYLFCWSGEKK